MISALEFVPSGACKREPIRFELSPEEAAQLKAAADAEEMELGGGGGGGAAAEDEEGDWEDVDEDEEGEMGESRAAAAAAVIGKDTDASGLPAELRMDEYDAEEVSRLLRLRLRLRLGLCFTAASAPTPSTDPLTKPTHIPPHPALHRRRRAAGACLT